MVASGSVRAEAQDCPETAGSSFSLLCCPPSPGRGDSTQPVSPGTTHRCHGEHTDGYCSSLLFQTCGLSYPRRTQHLKSLPGFISILWPFLNVDTQKSLSIHSAPLPPCQHLPLRCSCDVGVHRALPLWGSVSTHSTSSRLI